MGGGCSKLPPSLPFFASFFCRPGVARERHSLTLFTSIGNIHCSVTTTLLSLSQDEKCRVQGVLEIIEFYLKLELSVFIVSSYSSALVSVEFLCFFLVISCNLKKFQSKLINLKFVRANLIQI